MRAANERRGVEPEPKCRRVCGDGRDTRVTRVTRALQWWPLSGGGSNRQRPPVTAFTSVTSPLFT